jgi:RND family efflux transporter MFP subunit
MKTHFLLLMLTLLAACTKKEASKEKAKIEAITVSMGAVSQEILSRPIMASGLISSSDEARLSFKIGGVIEQILVKEGQNVSKGQLLATLNQTEIAAQVSQAKEGVQKSERDLKRIGNLYRDSVATKEQFQNVNTALALAQENLQIAQFNQQYAQIKAPISGKILRKLMNEGEVTGPGSPVFFVIGTGTKDWILKAGLADRDWARVRLGDHADVHLDAYPERTFDATVTKLSDLADPMTGTFATELTINPAGQKIATGLMGSISINKKDAIATTVIPIEALVEADGNRGFVYVVENGKAKRKAVNVAYLLGDKVVIASGLEGQSRVVTAGAMYLSEGAKVLVK